MWIENPTEEGVLNISEYELIKPCSINKTHVDFYRIPVNKGERGTPDYTLVFESEEKRDAWFKEFVESINVIVPSQYGSEDEMFQLERD